MEMMTGGGKLVERIFRIRKRNGLTREVVSITLEKQLLSPIEKFRAKIEQHTFH